MSDSPDELTLILVGDERSPVRRIQFLRKRIVHGAVAAGFATIALLAIAADWVRLRMEAVDVAALRVETASQADAVGRLHEEVTALAAGVDEVRELERKVRVIADLPGGMMHAQTPEEVEPPTANEEAPTLVDGDAAVDPELSVPASAPVPAKLAPETPPRSADAEEAGEPIESADLSGWLESVSARADALALMIPTQKESLEHLVTGLEGKSEQLEATPSIWPTDGWVTSSYGYRTSPFTGRRQFHKGIDIAASFGTQIVSPASGRVTFAGRKGAMGRSVVIEHGYGLRTTYGHMAKVSVKKGQQVERGEPIGVVGSTGRSTGPHLHYSVARSGRTVNPRDYVIE